MTFWFSKQPGETVALGVEGEDPVQDAALLYGAECPDWIRLPPDLGGGQAKVVGFEQATCPAHHDHACRHYHLDNGVSVAECDQFYWYRRAR